MNYQDFYKPFVRAIYSTPQALKTDAAVRCMARLPDVPVHIVDSKEDIPSFDRIQKTLFLTVPRGRKTSRCPGSRRHLCCNYLTVNLYEGCPIGCTYCIMRTYLNFEPVTVNVDTTEMLADIDRLVAANPGTPLRLGTGEVGDSLFYDPLFELSADFIRHCAQYPDVRFEVKTKSHFVDHILDIKPKGRAVVAFSLNPESVRVAEEGAAATVAERLCSAAKALEAGYSLAFHFDPIIRIPGWEEQYRPIAESLAAFRGHIAWISMGTVRYPVPLKHKMGGRPYLLDEFVPCRDNKYRYIQRVREEMYRKMADWLVTGTGAPVYLCMESPAVWKAVFGKISSKIDNLCAIFNRVSTE